MTVNRPQGALFEISIDGTPRTYRDEKPRAIESAQQLKLKRKRKHSAVTVENLQTGEKTAVEYKPTRACTEDEERARAFCPNRSASQCAQGTHRAAA